MPFKHFSHHHPLNFEEDLPNDCKQEHICEGCGLKISGPLYSCRQCKYFLHKSCARLRRMIKHPMHPKHDVTLLARPYYDFNFCTCEACHKDWNRFTYNCAFCKFDICILCAYEVKELQHKSHGHTLRVNPTAAVFHCSACDTISHDDRSYWCPKCPYWIHKYCASLPVTISTRHHDHPLTLAYSMPQQFTDKDYLCRICRELVRAPYWLYYCARCKYFAHVKCATKGHNPLDTSH